MFLRFIFLQKVKNDIDAIVFWNSQSCLAKTVRLGSGTVGMKSMVNHVFSLDERKEEVSELHKNSY